MNIGKGEIMNTAAVVIAAGLPKFDSVPAAMHKVGTVSSAQHVIASLQKAGITAIYLAVDETTKKLEKQLSPSGALFIRTSGSPLECAKQAIVGLPRHYDRVLICTADRPLVMPDSINKLMSHHGDVAVLQSKGKESSFCIVSMDAAEILCADTGENNLSAALDKLGYVKEVIQTEDAGLFMTPRKAASSEVELEAHQNALTRPLLDVSIFGQQTIFDPRLIKLLRLVNDLRSVRSACEMCGMSYSIAWNLLNSAEAELGYPLVKRNQGGRSGTGSELTPKGRQIMEAYNAFETELNKKMNTLFEECFREIL